MTDAPNPLLRTPLRRAGHKLRSHWRRRVLVRMVRDDPPHPTPIALMLPVAPKDVERARLAIDSMRRMIAHPLERIVIAAPDHPSTRALAAETGARFVDEREPLSALLDEAALAGLAGWHKQQFLKLTAPEIAGCEYALCIDCDTILNRRTAWLTPDGRTILLSAETSIHGYYEFAEHLIGPFRRELFGYVAHNMLFRGRDLADLRACIEAHTGRPWAPAMLDALARHGPESMSEFELMARYLLRDHPGRVTTRYFAGRTISDAQYFGRVPQSKRNRRLRFQSSHDHAF